jgi:hypothetical protein
MVIYIIYSMTYARRSGSRILCLEHASFSHGTCQTRVLHVLGIKVYTSTNETSTNSTNLYVRNLSPNPRWDYIRVRSQESFPRRRLRRQVFLIVSGTSKMILKNEHLNIFSFFCESSFVHIVIRQHLLGQLHNGFVSFSWNSCSFFFF